MWNHSWRYAEGWTICIGIYFTGLILQFSLGKIVPEAFASPINLIFGSIFILALTICHIASKKNKALRWFSSYTAAITSITALLVLTIFMGLTRQLSNTADLSNANLVVRIGFNQMIVSWPFLLMMLYFLWTLGMVTLRRLSRFKWKKDIGFALNHLGLFITLYAGVFSFGDFQRLRMTVHANAPEWRAVDHNDELVELPLAIELTQFIREQFPPKLLLVDNVSGYALPEGRPINVSIEQYPSMHQLFDWQLEVVRHFESAAIMATADTVNAVEFHGIGATGAIYVKAQNVTNGAKTEGWVSYGSYLFPFAALRLSDEVSLVMPNPEASRYASEVVVYTKNGIRKEALVEVNSPLNVNGWRIYQTSYDANAGRWSQYSVFELIKDPWLNVVWIGIAMLLLGCVFLFFSAPKKIDNNKMDNKKENV
jgi:hypothetical protein